MSDTLYDIKIAQEKPFKTATGLWALAVISLVVPAAAQFSNQPQAFLVGYVSVLVITIPSALSFRLRGESNEMTFADEERMVVNRRRRRRLPVVLIPALALAVVSLIRLSLAIS